MGKKHCLIIPYREIKTIDQGKWIGIEEKTWIEIKKVLEHDFIIKMEKKI